MTLSMRLLLTGLAVALSQTPPPIEDECCAQSRCSRPNDGICPSCAQGEWCSYDDAFGKRVCTVKQPVGQACFNLGGGDRCATNICQPSGGSANARLGFPGICVWWCDKAAVAATSSFTDCWHAGEDAGTLPNTRCEETLNEDECCAKGRCDRPYDGKDDACPTCPSGQWCEAGGAFGPNTCTDKTPDGGVCYFQGGGDRCQNGVCVPSVNGIPEGSPSLGRGGTCAAACTGSEDCWIDGQAPNTFQCKADSVNGPWKAFGIWSDFPSMDEWCNNNCGNSEFPFCPAQFCVVDPLG